MLENEFRLRIVFVSNDLVWRMHFGECSSVKSMEEWKEVLCICRTTSVQFWCKVASVSQKILAANDFRKNVFFGEQKA